MPPLVRPGSAGQTPWQTGFHRMAQQVAAALGDGPAVSPRTDLYRPLPPDPMAWLVATFPTYFQNPRGEPVPLAAHHEEFWQWLWALRPGLPARTFIQILSRGGGKSTELELGSAVVGYFGLRRYTLYLCATQSQADDHVATVATLFETLGVERAMSRYGFSLGWNINRLHTADGYTEDAIGLDKAVRGVKRYEARPDLVLADELDEQHDTLDTIEKKIDTLTRKVLPTGSSALAVAGVQNLPNKDGIFAQMADGRAEFLLDRYVSGPHPAMRGLPEQDWYTQELGPDGSPILRLPYGEPVWAGQDRAACEALLTKIGPRAFVIECHPAGTRVRLATNQLLPIEDLHPGMVVTTHVGRPRPITQTMSRLYTGEMVALKRCGASALLSMTATHPLLIARRPAARTWWGRDHGKGRIGAGGRRNVAALTYSWVEAGAVRKGDFLVEPLPQAPEQVSDGTVLWTFRPRRTGRRARGQQAIVLTPALARLLGYYLAEGVPLSSYVVQLTFHANETVYVEDVVQLFEKVFGIVAAVRASNGNSVVVCAESVIVGEFFQWVGQGARTKSVPPWMFSASRQCIEQLLIGYLRGDGCKDPSGFAYNSVSEQLAEDIRLLLLRLDIIAHVYELKPRMVRLPQGTLYFRSAHWQGDINGGGAAALGRILGVPHDSLGRNAAFIANGYVHYPIRSVHRHAVAAVPVYNCDVTDDHSFLANGVASHNCQHKIAALEGKLFKREWFPIVSDWPRGAALVRYWDFAATDEPDQRRRTKDPDWTVGVLLAMAQGQFWVVDIQRARLSPQGVEVLVKQTAQVDGRRVAIWLEEEGGSSGKSVTAHYRQTVLVGYNVHTWHTTGAKGERARAVSSAAEAGNVFLVSAPWNSAFLDEVPRFGLPGVHDDIVDALSGAHYALTLGALTLPQDFSLTPGVRGLAQPGYEARALAAPVLPGAVLALWGAGTDDDVR
jgi:predicted phage terminase large subunit-like protein